MTLRVLFVCTGNICRSPAAERLFLARLPTCDITATSAGTHALSGYPIDAPSALALRELGVDPAGHLAKQVTPALTASADLILGAQTGHCSVLVRSEPLLFRKVFTLREFGRLGAVAAAPDEPSPASSPGSSPGPSADPSAGPPPAQLLRERIAEIASLRGTVDPVGPGADDVGDPFGGGVDAARRCTATIADAVDTVIRALGLASGSAPVVLR